MDPQSKIWKWRKRTGFHHRVIVRVSTIWYSTNVRLLMSCFHQSEHLFSLKRFSKQKIKKLGKEEQVLKEKKLIKHICASPGVPQVLCTCADQTYVGILLNTLISCPIASILHSPLDESSARFCAASVVVSLEELHKVRCIATSHFQHLKHPFIY